MKTPSECTCSPHGHPMTTNTTLLRDVRRHSLQRANLYRSGDLDHEATQVQREEVAVCNEWTAHQCLARLRELKGGAA